MPVVMVMVLVVEVSLDTSVDKVNMTRCGRKVLFVQLTRGDAAWSCEMYDML